MDCRKIDFQLAVLESLLIEYCVCVDGRGWWNVTPFFLSSITQEVQ